MKRTIRLTESELIKIVKKVIKENEPKVMLRKMTKKSVLGDEGGIYRNWTVQKLLDNAPKKVFQIYTNYEKITFVDEVLDELKEKGFPVKPIQKPGVDKEQYREYMEKGSAKFYSNLESKSIEDIQKLLRAKGINKQFIDPNIYRILDKKRQEADDSYRLNKNVERKFVMASKNHDKFRK